MRLTGGSEECSQRQDVSQPLGVLDVCREQAPEIALAEVDLELEPWPYVILGQSA